MIKEILLLLEYTATKSLKSRMCLQLKPKSCATLSNVSRGGTATCNIVSCACHDPRNMLSVSFEVKKLVLSISCKNKNKKLSCLVPPVAK